MVHAAAVMPFNARVDGDTARTHLSEGPLPDMIFLQTSRSEFTKADRVVSHFMQKNAGTHGRARMRCRYQPFDIPITVMKFIRHTAHAPTPFSDADIKA